MDEQQALSRASALGDRPGNISLPISVALSASLFSPIRGPIPAPCCDSEAPQSAVLTHSVLSNTVGSRDPTCQEKSSDREAGLWRGDPTSS